ISFAWLSSFIYNSNADLTRIKSDAMIRVQVESTKRRNSESLALDESSKVAY
ncbi:39580_t:CDS:1, partial [Gigaspora margarita]